MGLRAILRVHAGEFAVAAASSVARLQDAMVRCVAVLLLDRFGDFAQGSVDAPVRKVVAQCLGFIAGSLPGDCVELLVRVLRECVVGEAVPWHARHGAFLAVRATVQLGLPEQHAGALADDLQDMCVRGLADQVDDVRCAAAESLEALLRIQPLPSHGWDGAGDFQRALLGAIRALEDTDARAESVGYIAQHTVQWVVSRNGDDGVAEGDDAWLRCQLVPWLLPLLRHPAVHVRRSVAATLRCIVLERMPEWVIDASIGRREEHVDVVDGDAVGPLARLDHSVAQTGIPQRVLRRCESIPLQEWATGIQETVRAMVIESDKETREECMQLLLAWFSLLLPPAAEVMQSEPIVDHFAASSAPCAWDPEQDACVGATFVLPLLAPLLEVWLSVMQLPQGTALETQQWNSISAMAALTTCTDVHEERWLRWTRSRPPVPLQPARQVLLATIIATALQHVPVAWRHRWMGAHIEVQPGGEHAPSAIQAILRAVLSLSVYRSDASWCRLVPTCSGSWIEDSLEPQVGEAEDADSVQAATEENEAQALELELTESVVCIARTMLDTGSPDSSSAIIPLPEMNLPRDGAWQEMKALGHMLAHAAFEWASLLDSATTWSIASWREELGASSVTSTSPADWQSPGLCHALLEATWKIDVCQAAAGGGRSRTRERALHADAEEARNALIRAYRSWEEARETWNVRGKTLPAALLARSSDLDAADCLQHAANEPDMMVQALWLGVACSRTRTARSAEQALAAWQERLCDPMAVVQRQSSRPWRGWLEHWASEIPQNCDAIAKNAFPSRVWMFAARMDHWTNVMTCVFPSLVDAVQRCESRWCRRLAEETLSRAIERRPQMEALAMIGGLIDHVAPISSFCAAILSILQTAAKRVPARARPWAAVGLRASLPLLSAPDTSVRTAAGAMLAQWLPLVHVRNCKENMIGTDDDDDFPAEWKSRWEAADAWVSQLEQGLRARSTQRGEMPRMGGPGEPSFKSSLEECFHRIRPAEPPLWGFQEDGVRWLLFLQEFGLAGVLADDMGLGKTLQVLCALATLAVRPESDSGCPTAIRRNGCLVVCPASVLHHWTQEVEKFFPHQPWLQPVVFAGPPRKRLAVWDRLADMDCPLVVTSYAMVRNECARLSQRQWAYIVLDEGHVIQNRHSSTAKAVKRLSALHRLILSGTPVQNSVLDLWSLFDFLMPGFLGTHADFQCTFARPLQAASMSVMDSATSDIAAHPSLALMQEVHRRVLPFILRRVKEEVMPDLPPKIVQDLICEMPPRQREVYDRLSADASGAEGEALTRLQLLRHACIHPRLVSSSKVARRKEEFPLEDSGKFLALRELLEEAGLGSSAASGRVSGRPRKRRRVQTPTSSETAAMPGETTASEEEATPAGAGGLHRVLLFAQTRRALDAVEDGLLRPYFPGLQYARIDGSVPGVERGRVAEAFQRSVGLELLMLTTSVGGLGLNLTGADIVVFLDHDWNPMRDLQAMDRAHRPGQARTVSVYRLISRGTIEEKILGLQRFKLHVAQTVVDHDNASLDAMGEVDVLELLRTTSRASDGRSEESDHADFWREAQQ